MHYFRSGTGRPPVVLIHGSDGVLQDFTLSGVFDALARRHTVIAFYRPGHGYSERPPGVPLTLGLNARLIRQALADLGVERPLLVGHSYGGAVVLRYALDYPDEVAGVVHLADAAYAQGNVVHPMHYLPAVPLIGPLLTHTLVPIGGPVARSMNRPAFHPHPVPRQWEQTLEAFSLRPAQFPNFAEEYRAFIDDLRAMEADYADIRVPLTVVVGSHDRVAPPDLHGRRLRDAVPDATLIVVDGAGHQVHHHDPGAVVAAVDRTVHDARAGPDSRAELGKSTD